MSLIKREGGDVKPSVGSVFDRLKKVSKADNLVQSGSGQVFYLLDRSGSMDDSIDELNSAAIAAMSAIRASVTVSAIPFPDPVVIDSRVFEPLHAYGGTPMEKAFDLLLTAAPDGSHAILMSDGQPNNQELVFRAARLCAERRIVVHTVPFGDAAEDFLREVARITGGEFKPAHAVADLAPVFLALGRKAVAALTSGQKAIPMEGTRD